MDFFSNSSSGTFSPTITSIEFALWSLKCDFSLVVVPVSGAGSVMFGFKEGGSPLFGCAVDDFCCVAVVD